MSVLVVRDLIRNYKKTTGKNKDEIKVLKGLNFAVEPVSYTHLTLPTN